MPQPLQKRYGQRREEELRGLHNERPLQLSRIEFCSGAQDLVGSAQKPTEFITDLDSARRGHQPLSGAHQ
ncbi:Uncharacterised protein [Mycobacteroides abscessus subsp. abscessus]|nr:Uncharacterised protein [Mycobacteroides abscessus subsp. abscessus]